MRQSWYNVDAMCVFQLAISGGFAMSQRKKSQASSRPTAARRSKSAAKSVEPGQRAQAPV